MVAKMKRNVAKGSTYRNIYELPIYNPLKDAKGSPRGGQCLSFMSFKLNWSHVSSILPKPLGDVWDAIPDTMAPGDPERASRLGAQLQSLARYDMAWVSERQLEALRAIISDTAAPDRGRQLRVAAMHHHLRSPSLREELKPFSDMSNLEQVRAFLRGSHMGVVVHGHKHEHATYFAKSSTGLRNSQSVISGGRRNNYRVLRGSSETKQRATILE
jgi:hypothetical protein